MQIEVFGTGTIVPGGKEIQGVADGVIEMTMQSPYYIKDRFPQAAPFAYTIAGLRTMEMMLWLIAEGNDMLNEGIAPLGLYSYPGWVKLPEMFLTTNKELKTPDDIKGLKIRTAGDDGEVLTRMGAAVVTLPVGEVYESMQRGVIDAFQLGTPSTDKNYGMFEVSQFIYLSPVRQPTENVPPFVSIEKWNELPDDIKAAMQAALYEEVFVNTEEQTRLDAEAVQFFLDKGLTVGPAPKSIEDAMVVAADEFYSERAATDPIYAKILESVNTWKDSFRSTYPLGL